VICGLWAAALSAAIKAQDVVILSEAKNLSLVFLSAQIEERFFASLRMTITTDERAEIPS